MITLNAEHILVNNRHGDYNWPHGDCGWIGEKYTDQIMTQIANYKLGYVLM